MSPWTRRWIVVATCLVVLAPQPALAHGGVYAGADNVATVLVAVDLAVIAWFRHLGRKAKAAGATLLARKRWVLLPVAVGLPLAAVTTTSWVPKNLPSKNRPVSTAHLEIVAPRPNAVVGRSFNVELRLLGGRLVPLYTVKNRPNVGHIHVSIDGQLVSMLDGLKWPVNDLKPGPHSLSAEFVAADHGPFRNRVIASEQVEVSP